MSTWTWNGAELERTSTDDRQQPARQWQMDSCGNLWCYATSPEQTLDLVLTAQDLGEQPALEQLAPGVDLDDMRLAHEAGQPSASECTIAPSGDRARCSVQLGGEPWTFSSSVLGYQFYDQPGLLWVLTGVDPA